MVSQRVFGHFRGSSRRHMLVEAPHGTENSLIRDVISERIQSGQPSTAHSFQKLGLSQVWVRFLLAIFGLALAFGAALFSTILGESGNLWGTIILASTALLLATFVGLTTVPYLARRVVASRVREAMDYDVTRAGLIYILISVVIGIAAINTGNNLLYVVVAALLSAILVSGVASALVLRSLELDVHLPEHVFAGRPMLARLLLRNSSSWLPSFSVRVVPAKRKVKDRWQWEAYTLGLPRNRAPQNQWLRLPDRRLRRVREEAEKPILQESVYFPFLAPGQELRADLEIKFPARGRYCEKNFGLATRFPFSFLMKTRRINLAREVIVFPVVESVEQFLEVLPMVTGEFEAFVSGRGNDLYLIRDYMPDDSARHVDWKATARTGALKVREFSREDERKLRIVFDNPAPGVLPPAAYERGVRLAASLGWHFHHEDVEVCFVAPGLEPTEDVFAFLRYLALVEPQEATPIFSRLRASDDYNLVVTARAAAELPSALATRSYVISLAEARRG
ncbi:MAG TPA: DUF58 domain-containing protein [Terriglobales bacterium]|nr:DUF58 domain-containing protein [Terriglobales bacterium]